MKLQNVFLKAFIRRNQIGLFAAFLVWHVTCTEIDFRTVLYNTFELQPKITAICRSFDKLNMCLQAIRYIDRNSSCRPA